MTTASWSTRVRMDSDATYQEWRDEFITKLNTMTTLVADETNITPGAGARAAANNEQGYAVYHLNDSLHGSAPIYIRFGFGSGSTNQIPRIQITTGTSTNGSGVLGGTALSTIASCHGAGIAQTTDTARQSYMSCTEGFFGFMWKIGANTNEAGFIICRTCDSDGAITTTGSFARWGGGNGDAGIITKSQGFRYIATAAAYTASASTLTYMLCFPAFYATSSLVGSDNQVYVCWGSWPRMAPMIGLCGVYASEFALGTTFTATLVGSTSRTYLAMNAKSIGPPDTFNGSAVVMVFGMLWE